MNRLRITIFLVLTAAISATAQNLTNRPANWAQPMTLPGVTNFYQVTANLYRGAQPTAEGMKQLKTLGVRCVISLRELRSDRHELYGTGLKSVSFGMVPWRPNAGKVVEFLKAAIDTNNLPVFVHCEYGADRTGLMCAMYRIVVCDWTKDEAIAEMKDGGFGFNPTWRQLIPFIEKADVAAYKRRIGLPGGDDGGLRTGDGKKNGGQLGPSSMLNRQSSASGGLGGGFRLPSALGRLGHEALLEGAGGHAHITDLAVGQEGLHALEVHPELAFGDGGHVRTDTAGLFGLTRAPDDAALHRAFAS